MRNPHIACKVQYIYFIRFIQYLYKKIGVCFAGTCSPFIQPEFRTVFKACLNNVAPVLQISIYQILSIKVLVFDHVNDIWHLTLFIIFINIQASAFHQISGFHKGKLQTVLRQFAKLAFLIK